MEHVYKFSHPLKEGVILPLLEEVPALDHEKEESLIPTVNIHPLWPCNMKCKHCFATFAEVGDTLLSSHHLPREEGVKLIHEVLKLKGVKKINFAGGEPFMLPYIADLVKTVKAINPNIITSIVTNGSIIHQRGIKALQQFEVDGVNQLDMLVLSVDSVNPATLDLTGRRTGKKPMSEDDYLEVCRLVAEAEISELKINTVVNEANWLENLKPFIEKVQKVKKLIYWKIIGMARRVDSQPEEHYDAFAIDSWEYKEFAKNNGEGWAGKLKVIYEPAEATLNSYIMIDPWGRFFWPTPKGNGIAYTYGKPILKVGLKAAFAELKPHLSESAYHSRGGQEINKTYRIDKVRNDEMDMVWGVDDEGRPKEYESFEGLLRHIDRTVREMRFSLFSDTNEIISFWHTKAYRLRNIKDYFPLLDEKKTGMIEALEIIAKNFPQSEAGEIIRKMHEAYDAEFLPFSQVMAAEEAQEDSQEDETMTKKYGRIRRMLATLGMQRARE